MNTSTSKTAFSTPSHQPILQNPEDKKMSKEEKHLLAVSNASSTVNPFIGTQYECDSSKNLVIGQELYFRPRIATKTAVRVILRGFPSDWKKSQKVKIEFLENFGHNFGAKGSTFKVKRALVSNKKLNYETTYPYTLFNTKQEAEEYTFPEEDIRVYKKTRKPNKNGGSKKKKKGKVSLTLKEYYDRRVAFYAQNPHGSNMERKEKYFERIELELRLRSMSKTKYGILTEQSRIKYDAEYEAVAQQERDALQSKEDDKKEKSLLEAKLIAQFRANLNMDAEFEKAKTKSKVNIKVPKKKVVVVETKPSVEELVEEPIEEDEEPYYWNDAGGDFDDYDKEELIAISKHHETGLKFRKNASVDKVRESVAEALDGNLLIDGW